MKLTKRVVDAIKPGPKRVTVWDDELGGFGVRVEPSGRTSFICRYRANGGGRGAPERLMVLGRHGELTADEARRLAKDILARVRLGEDPGGERTAARDAITVSDLVTKFMVEEVRPLRKASTAALYDIYFDKHIRPALGNRKASSVTHSDVAKWHRQVGEAARVTANRALTTLSAAYAWGLKAGELKGSNPCTTIKKFAEEARERFLTGEELARLAEALREAEGPGIPWTPNPEKLTKHAPKPENRRVVLGPHPVAAIRLLLLTGARLREILHLRWENVDFERGLLLLPDSKTGKKTILINAPSLSILAGLPRMGAYVIAGDNPEKPRADLQRPWALVSRRAGLEGVRLHDLRHTFASVGAGGGMGLPVLGRLLGHAQPATTQRYAHVGDDPLRNASNAIARRIVEAMGEAPSEEKAGEVVPFGRASAG